MRISHAAVGAASTSAACVECGTSGAQMSLCGRPKRFGQTPHPIHDSHGTFLPRYGRCHQYPYPPKTLGEPQENRFWGARAGPALHPVFTPECGLGSAASSRIAAALAENCAPLRGRRATAITMSSCPTHSHLHQFKCPHGIVPSR